MGLYLPLEQVSVDPHTSPIRASLGPTLRDDAASWQFEQVRIGTSHMMALAIRRRAGTDWRVTVRQAHADLDIQTPHYRIRELI